MHSATRVSSFLALVLFLACSGDLTPIESGAADGRSGVGATGGSGGMSVAGQGGSVAGGAGSGEAGRAGSGEAGRAGSGEAGRAGSGEAGRAGSGEAGRAGYGGGMAGSSGGSSGSGASAGAGGGVVNECSLTTGYYKCDDCLDTHCAPECDRCENSDSCVSLFECLVMCPPQSSSCPDKCVQRFPAGLDGLLSIFGEDDGCVERYCPSACGGGSSGSAGSSGAGGASPSSCPIPFPSPQCDSCVDKFCVDTCWDCLNEPQCVDLLKCADPCDNNDVSCLGACMAEFPQGITPMLAFVGDQGCVAKRCPAYCRQ